MRGIVTRGVGGLYGVRLAERPEEEILCCARGILRQKKISPTVGDDVRVELADEEDRKEPLILPEEARGRGSRMKRTEKKDRGVDVDYVIDTVEERRSLLIRPPIANLDILFAVIPCASPEPDLLTAD